MIREMSRSVLGKSLTALVSVSLALHGCAPILPQSRATARQPYSALVDGHYTGPEGAIVGGLPAYRTIGAALAAAPATATRQHRIFIRHGRYSEKLSVDKPNIHLIGESRDGAVLTYDAASSTRDPAGGEYGTRGSFTLRVTAPDFRAENLTIENAFDYPVNVAKAADDPTRLRNIQAVALMTAGASDRAEFVNTKITGYPDTLLADSGRHYFYQCVVSGNVDFIFGAGQAVFDDCDIISRDRGSQTNNGYITAASTNIRQPYGFLFINSRLKKESPAMARNSVALGRPWHPGGDSTAVASVVFIDTWMDDDISERGWTQMGGFQPEDARLFEYRSTGPGARSSSSRRVLTEEEARRYTAERVLNGWTPKR